MWQKNNPDDVMKAMGLTFLNEKATSQDVSVKF